MIGFEADKWERRKVRNDWYIFVHKEFKFINISCQKKYKDYDKNAWKIKISAWSTKLKTPLYLYVFYKRFTLDKIEKIFNDFMGYDDFKYVVLDYLFKGEW